TDCDIFIGTNDITVQLKPLGVTPKIVSLANMVDKVAMKQRLSTALQELGAL
ncbi:PTS ascorbate transporter subunit IIB, partial [Vibrio cholerae]|nr:PTS ascorbate transporter subunit IIB [Vibrio cholerae]